MSENCFNLCNEVYSSLNPDRVFCKKACESDFEKEKCREETCDSLCIKKEIGNEKKWGGKN